MEPKHPFLTKPHLISPDKSLNVWFTEPPGFVSEYVGCGEYSLDTANFLIDEAWAALCAVYPRDIRFLGVHDLSRVTSVAGPVRARFTRWSIGIRDKVERVVLCMSHQTPAVVRMGYAAASAVLMAAGFPLELRVSASRAVVDDLHLRVGEKPLTMYRLQQIRRI